MRTTTHLKNGTQECSWKPNGIMDAPLCRGEHSMFDSYTENPEVIECPKCSAKWASTQMKSSDRKITIEPADVGGYKGKGGYRSIYAVSLDGEPHGYVTLDGGKRARWELRTLSLSRPSKEVPSANPNSTRTYTRDIIPSRKSKEQAALDILKYIEFFKSKSQYDADNARYEVEIEKRRKSMSEERVQRGRDYDMALDVLARLRYQEGMSNEEVYALEIALKALQDVKGLNG